jgi:hypothetical protein
MTEIYDRNPNPTPNQNPIKYYYQSAAIIFYNYSDISNYDLKSAHWRRGIPNAFALILPAMSASAPPRPRQHWMSAGALNQICFYKVLV